MLLPVLVKEDKNLTFKEVDLSQKDIELVPTVHYIDGENSIIPMFRIGDECYVEGLYCQEVYDPEYEFHTIFLPLSIFDYYPENDDYNRHISALQERFMQDGLIGKMSAEEMKEAFSNTITNCKKKDLFDHVILLDYDQEITIHDEYVPYQSYRILQMPLEIPMQVLQIANPDAKDNHLVMFHIVLEYEQKIYTPIRWISEPNAKNALEMPPIYISETFFDEYMPTESLN